MKHNPNGAIWLRGILAAFTLALVAAAVFIPGVGPNLAQTKQRDEAQTNLTEAEKAFLPHMEFVMNQLSQQSDIEQSIRAELSSGQYSLEQPLVVVNPYEISPLSAVVVFTTKDPACVSVHVPGKDALSDVDFSFDAYSTEHVVPVYGLYADTTNAVTLVTKSKDGVEQSAVIDITTGAMPDKISEIVLLTDLAKPEQYQPGLNFMYETKAAFDVNGDYRWYLDGEYKAPTNYDYLNGHFLVMLGSSYKENPVVFLEIDPLGKIFKVLYAPYACHHDMELSDSTTLLITGSEGETVEDLIYELDTDKGMIVNKLDLKTIFPRMREGLWETENADWLHLNDIVRISGEDDILISSRHQSFVARISWPEGKIKWILSSHDHWPEMFEKYLLTPIGDDFEWQYNQHAPYILPDQDQNPDTIDFLVYDNGNQRFGSEDNDPSGLYTRIVHYQIDEKNMTVRQVWQYGKEIGESLYASSRGNACPVENGNLVASYCIQADKTFWAEYREITTDAQLVWQAIAYTKAETGKLYEYRVSRMPLYLPSAVTLSWDEQAINLIPTEVLTRYGFQ